MSIGTRISELRKRNHYTQEYVAEQLDISRQAVSKWEKDLTSPDTGNLIKLAELLGSSVEYIATGREQEYMTSHIPVQESELPKKRNRLTGKQKVSSIIVGMMLLILICVSGVGTYIRGQPVDWDAGACGQGYVTYIFDKYEDELVQKYVDGSGYGGTISNVQAVHGTQEAAWEGQKIYLQFDVQYEHKTEGTVVETLRFVGTRKWIDTFAWSGAWIAD